MSDVFWQPGMKLKEVEKLTVQAALRFTAGHRQTAAEMLGISLRTIETKIKLFNLVVNTGETPDNIVLPKSKQVPTLGATLKINIGKTSCSVTEISTEVLLGIEEQVKKNHANKSFYILSQEGGLSPVEIYAAFHKITPAEAKKKSVSPQKAADWLEKQYGPAELS